MSVTDATAAETPDRTEAVAGEQVAASEAENSRLALGAQRVREYLVRAERERQAAIALRADKKPSSALQRARRVAEIDRMRAAYAVPATSTDPTAQTLKEINTSLRAIRDSVISNPLWQEATDLEYALAPLPGAHLRHALQAMEPELAVARDEVARCAGTLLDAEEVLRAWESRPAWIRAAQDRLLQTGQRAREQLTAARAEVAAAQAALDEKYARAESRAAEAKAAEKRADQQRRERARFHREAVETPLREALLERAMLNHALRGRDVQPLREAPTAERLTMLSMHDAHGFTVLVLESPTTTYVADWGSLDEQEKANLARSIGGDIFRYEHANGARVLSPVELAPLTPEHPVLEGLVGATHHRNEQILEFQLIDPSGTARWVKPSRGQDLMQELRGDVAEALISGTRIRIQNRDVHILSRPRSAGLER